MIKRLVNTPKLLTALLAGLLLILIQGIYFQNSLNTFHFDDRFSIVEHTPIHMMHFSWSGLWQAGAEAYHSTRPLPNVTFAFDWWRGGGDPASFLETNLIIHSLNSLLVMVLLLLILGRLYPERPLLNGVIAFASAAVWALHPIQVQAVSYIVQRMASMAALFTLLALYAYLQARFSRSWKAGAIWLSISFISLIAGMLSKELAWIAPFLLLLAEYTLVRNNREPLFSNRYDWAILIIPFLGALILALIVIMDYGKLANYLNNFYNIRNFTLEERVLTQPRVILFYLSLIFWPLPSRFSLEHDFVISQSLIMPPSTLLAIGCIGAWCALAIWLWRKPGLRVWAFFVAWLPVSLSVESSIIGLEMIFEHRMYLPMFGLVGLLALLMCCVMAYPRYQVAAWLLVAGMIVGLGYSTMLRVPQWQTTEQLLINSTIHAGGTARSWSNLGRYYIDNGDYQKAKPAIQKALALAPDSASALEAMGTILLSEGRLAEARSYLIKAYRTNLVGHSWLGNMAWLHLEEVARGIRPRNFLDKGLEFIRQAQQQAPYEPHYVKVGARLFEQMGDCSSAYREWRRYLTFSLRPQELEHIKQHLRESYSSNGLNCRFPQRSQRDG